MLLFNCIFNTLRGDCSVTPISEIQLFSITKDYYFRSKRAIETEEVAKWLELEESSREGQIINSTG